MTAEYSMLPGSTSPRKHRERDGKVDGRTTEIQRLIGRSLRAVVDLDAIGPRLLTVDCDVLEADGGTPHGEHYRSVYRAGRRAGNGRIARSETAADHQQRRGGERGIGRGPGRFWI